MEAVMRNDINEPEVTKDHLLELADVARLFGTTTRTIRNWEDRALIPPAKKLPNGRKAWWASDIRRLLTQQ